MSNHSAIKRLSAADNMSKCKSVGSSKRLKKSPDAVAPAIRAGGAIGITSRMGVPSDRVDTDDLLSRPQELR